MCTLLLCFYVEINPFMSPLRRWSPHPSVRTLFELNYFPRAPSPHTISLGVRELTYELGRGGPQFSVLSSVLFLILRVSLPTQIMSLLLFLHAVSLTAPGGIGCLILEFGISNSTWFINRKPGPSSWSLSTIKVIFWTYFTFCGPINQHHQFPSLRHI